MGVVFMRHCERQLEIMSAKKLQRCNFWIVDKQVLIALKH